MREGSRKISEGTRRKKIPCRSERYRAATRSRCDRTSGCNGIRRSQRYECPNRRKVVRSLAKQRESRRVLLSRFCSKGRVPHLMRARGTAFFHHPRREHTSLNRRTRTPGQIYRGGLRLALRAFLRIPFPGTRGRSTRRNVWRHRRNPGLRKGQWADRRSGHWHGKWSRGTLSSP